MSRSLNRRDFLGRMGASSLAATQLLPGILWPVPAGAAQRGSTGRGDRVAGPLAWSWWGWEPIDHYRRVGGVVGAVDADAPSLGPWYDRLHGEEIVKTMAGLGINLAITHFFKGFGLKHERVEQERTAALVRFAHRHGIKVLGYCQSRSLYYEAMLAEEPQCEDWIQRDADGKLRTWGAAYYRWAPCIESRAFRNYLKRVISFGLEEIELDGVHFDNDYLEACYCPRCEKAFRAWLTKRFPNPRQRFGVDSFAHVRQPPWGKAPRQIKDRLVRQWVRFRCESLGEYHRELAEHARGVRKDAILLGNPAYPRAGDEPYRRSVWIPLVGRHLDLVFAENGNFPGIEKGAVVSQVRAYKQGAAVGYRVVSTTWRHNRLTGLGLPDRPEQVCLQIAEAAANGGVPGTNWALRSAGPGAEMPIDEAKLREPLKQYLRFARDHAVESWNAAPVADVAVLHTFASRAFDYARLPEQLAAEEVLIRAGFSWGVVFADDLASLDAYKVLVLAGQTYLSDAECAAVRAFVERGGGLVLIGDCGIKDDFGLRRERPPLADLEGPRMCRLESDVVRTSVDTSYAMRVSMPKRWEELAEAVEQAAGDGLSVRLLGGDVVALSAHSAEEGRLAVHLVNYKAPDPKSGMRLSLGGKWKDAPSARIITPEGAEEKLEVRRVGGRMSIELPEVSVYGIVFVG